MKAPWDDSPAAYSPTVLGSFFPRLITSTIGGGGARTLVTVAFLASFFGFLASFFPLSRLPIMTPLNSVQVAVIRYEFSKEGLACKASIEMFKSLAGIELVHIPYKGSAPSIAELLGGHVPMAFDPLPSSIAHIKAGKLRALAVGSAKRSSSMSDLPTIVEAGVPGYEVNWWGSVLLPAGTPKKIVELLHVEIVKTLQVPEIRDRFSTLGYELVGSTTVQCKRFIENEVAKWGKIIRRANIRAD